MSATALPFTRRSDQQQPVRLLLVSPNLSMREQFRKRIGSPRWSLSEAGSAAEALEMLTASHTELLLLDPLLPDIVANDFSALVLQRFPAIEILTLDGQTGHLLLANASPTALATQLTEMMYRGTESEAAPQARPAEIRRGFGEQRTGLRGMVGRSSAMQRVYQLTEMVARTETTVLITGESGTGKDLVAQAVHMISPRDRHPFAVVNCAAIPEALLEAELFGYAKGAFTGAMQSRIGRIHAAHGGTLFLDEIGDMPLALQSKILRFLEQGEVQRLGANDNLKVDVRVVAATNAGLRSLVEQKLFREDLYYRLAVFPIALPPLRERDGDVPLITESFLQKYCPGAQITSEALEALAAHPWPGNVRELRNTIERASILMNGERSLRASHILF